MYESALAKTSIFFNEGNSSIRNSRVLNDNLFGVARVLTLPLEDD